LHLPLLLSDARLLFHHQVQQPPRHKHALDQLFASDESLHFGKLGQRFLAGLLIHVRRHHQAFPDFVPGLLDRLRLLFDHKLQIPVIFSYELENIAVQLGQHAGKSGGSPRYSAPALCGNALSVQR